MSFTGERFIPGEGGCQIAYEHLHRYYFALRWAGDGEALDLACGNGYGAALLARRARHVWALDIDGDTITDAYRNWRSDNLTFMQGDATRLPFRSRSIDLVVAMEALEHIKDQAQLLQEIARVCTENGTVLISTPNKAEYSDARKHINPFHIRELYLNEFVDLLKQHFPYVEIAGQQIRAGSLLSNNHSESLCEVIIEPPPGAEKTLVEPMYYVAVCGMEKPQEPVPAYSAYLDSTDGLIHEIRREGTQEVERLNGEIGRLGDWAKSLESVIGERDQILRDFQNEMKDEVALRDQAIRDLQKKLTQEVDSRDQVIRDLQIEVDLRDKAIRDLQIDVDSRDQAIRDIQSKFAQDVDSRDQAIRTLQEEMRVEIADRDQRILDLLNLLHQKEREFDDRGKWALSLQAEVERLAQIRRIFLYRTLSRLGLLPK